LLINSLLSLYSFSFYNYHWEGSSISCLHPAVVPGRAAFCQCCCGHIFF